MSEFHAHRLNSYSRRVIMLIALLVFSVFFVFRPASMVFGVMNFFKIMQLEWQFLGKFMKKIRSKIKVSDKDGKPLN